MAETSFQIFRSFIILRSGEGSTSFNNDNSADFFNGKKEYNEAFQGVCFLKNTWEKVKVNFYS